MFKGTEPHTDSNLSLTLSQKGVVNMKTHKYKLLIKMSQHTQHVRIEHDGKVFIKS